MTTNSDLHIAQSICFAGAGAAAATAGLLAAGVGKSRAAPPLVTTSARAAVTAQSDAMMRVIMVFMYLILCSVLLFPAIACLPCLRRARDNHSTAD